MPPVPLHWLEIGDSFYFTKDGKDCWAQIYHRNPLTSVQSFALIHDIMNDSVFPEYRNFTGNKFDASEIPGIEKLVELNPGDIFTFEKTKFQVLSYDGNTVSAIPVAEIKKFSPNLYVKTSSFEEKKGATP
jgi:Lhr-like helicase